MTIDLAGYFARYKGRPHEKAAVQLLSERMPASLLKPDAEWVELFDAATPDKPVALPLQLQQAHPLAELLKIIREGEGDYESVNRGKAGDTPGGWRGLLTETVADVKAAQAREQVFAVGAYQFIPTTLPMAQTAAKVKDSELFTAATQDRLAVGLLLGGKRPVLRDYLLGKHDRLADAQLDLAKEWASIPKADGRGVYDGDSAGNKATAKVAAIQAALIAGRQALMKAAPKAPAAPKVAKVAKVAKAPAPLIAREPQFYAQWDSTQVGQRSRMCSASSCAMHLKARKPDALKGSNADDDYLKVVQRFGDTTDYNAQIRALQHFGLDARLIKTGDWELVAEQIKRHGGLALGYIHRGPLDALRGAGHWLYGWGLDSTHITVHDPWADMNMVTGQEDGKSGRAKLYSRANFGRRWMVVPDGRGGWRYAPGNGYAIVAD